ncbi:MAG: cyclic di-GMP phosphodiesterase [Burkholderiales bacterium]|nr:cyclic di-GMP phosphodiesterase [Burkholderiales bacterium]MDE2608250.1 cyclic di-GMP phosphodiesterase [Burkholderiales bacterium]
MDNDLDYSILYEYFGTSSPYWRLASDSNALSLEAQRGSTNLSIALSAAQAGEVRGMTGVTSHRVLDVSIVGEPLRLHLVGRKVNPTQWAGTASAYADTVSVARDLVHGLSFAEQVVSEVNSLVVILDRHGRVQRFNRLCEEVTGMREEDVIGKSAFELFMSAEQGQASSRNISTFYNSGEPYEVERYINTVNGPRLFLFRNKFVQSGSGVDEQFLICSGTDITEERSAQKRLSELANTDGLTGLPNRNAIHEKIKTAIAAQAGQSNRVGILFLDLDNFKKVNDHYGHVVGDRLIRDVASLIQSCLGESDTLARLGGDEFVVVIEKSTIELLEATAQRILDRLRTPFHLGLMEIYTGCSIGIALYPDHGDGLESLIRSADTAMYVAKDAGKRTYRVFSPDMNKKVAEYMWLDTNLRKALDEQQLVLYYQPAVSLATGVVHGVEALIRWKSPERGLIPPTEFIRYAEESGLIGPLGRWVMQAAANQAMRWKAKGLNIRISINVSARQLCDTDIVNHFSHALDVAGLQPCLLDLELTESCFIEDEATAIGLIKKFRQLGAKVHLDDFGTGYSSLSQLARIPLDVIKLDRSFVAGIDANTKSQALVRSMAAIAQELRFAVIAEGVETRAEADFLKQVGVDYAQGFLYGKPMTAEEFEVWLSEQRRLRLIA